MPVQKVCLRGILFASLLLTGPVAWAQETPDLFSEEPGTTDSSAVPESSGSTSTPSSASTSSGSGSSSTKDETRLKMQLSFVDDVSIGEDLQVRAKITDQSIGTKSMRDTIELLGTVKTGEAVDGLVPSAITWSQVIRKDTSASSQLSDTLESRFRIAQDSPDVGANETVYAEGDVDGLVSAAMALLSDANAVANTPESTSKSSGSEGSASSFKTASNSQGDDSLFDNIDIPEPEAKVEAPDDVVTETTMGCDIKVDLDAGVARVQSQEVLNGNPQGNCAPNGTNYPLARSYAGCNDIVDMDARKAWASYKRFYVNGGGTNQNVDTECQKDEELVYDIFQKTDECTMEVDLVNNVVYQRGKWVYQSKNISSAWNEIEVSSCQRVESSSLPLDQTESGCTPRHDFDADISYQQTKYYYIEDGQHKVVSECNDSGLTYTHITNTDYCADLAPTNAQLSMTNGTRAVYKQVRTEIDIDGERVAITQCAPDQAKGTEVFQDPTGCDTTFYHYISSGQSFGSGRWKYQFSGEPEVVLSECLQDNDIEFTHQVRIADYQNNDDALVSTPKTEIYIETSGGEVIVSQAQVREGAVEIPYVFQQSLEVATGELFYEEESCEKWMRRNNVERYLRGDGVSTFDRVLGEAEALSQGDGCDVVITWAEPTNRVWVSNVSSEYFSWSGPPSEGSHTASGTNVCGYTTVSTTWGKNGGSDRGWYDAYAALTGPSHCRYTEAVAQRKVVREDGQQIGDAASNTCTLVNSSPSIYVTGYYFRKQSPVYSGYPTMTNANKSNCLGAWGWW